MVSYTPTVLTFASLVIFVIVFVSPETAQLPAWRAMFSAVKGKIALVAVDEAHCISKWLLYSKVCILNIKYNIFNRGTDFRKAFKEVGGLRALIEAPFMALTASAPAVVKEDIVASLFLSTPFSITCNLNRRNIYFSASPIKSLDVGL